MTNLKKYFNPNHKVTYGITAITTLVFVYMLITYGSNGMTSPYALVKSGALWGGVINSIFDLWRLVTPIFVHIGFAHFFFNIFAIYFIGAQVEEIFGSFRFFILYMFSGIFANAMSLCFSPETISAGASTSIFGMFAGVVALGYIANNSAFKEVAKGYLALIVFNLVSNLFEVNVSLLGHIGGVIGGILLAFAIPYNYPGMRNPKGVRFLALVIYLALLVFFCLFSIYR